jgi:autotransporter-associated beta strand protein
MEPVRLRHEISSVCSFLIEDGPAVVDVDFKGGVLEAGGSCGFTKSGPGTLRIAGNIRISGFITVYDGVLDLSAARAVGGLRINLLGDSRLRPPSTPEGAFELLVNGVKLAPGEWGPESSPALSGPIRVADTGPSRRDRWLDLKYGIFSHYVWNGYGMSAGMPNADGSFSKTIDELAESFDVANYVDQLVAAKAQYVVFTAWHSGTCPLFPSSAMEKWAPGRPDTPRRDLLGDLLDECRKRGVRPFFYCHPYQPVAEPHNDWINDLFAELVDRYGDRLDGLWIDENFQDCSQDKVVDYRRLMRTIKERNPELVLTHNNGGFQTYGVDEGVQEVQWEFHEGRMASIYQIFNQTAKSPEDMLLTTVIQAAANTMGGGVQWSIDAHGSGGGKRGGLDEKARPILDPFVKLLAPIADSVLNTRPSSSYPPPFSGTVVKLSSLTWGVATQSADERREFLHVLKPPAGKALTLPPPADGKVFAKARLLDGGQAVNLHQSNRGLVLTLPDGIEWKKPDTVIVLDVVAPGGIGLVNNTSRALQYRGASWSYQRDLASGGFRADAQRATADGDAFVFTFEGTDVEWLGSRGPKHGKVELAIDGVPQGEVDLSQGSGRFVSLFSKKGLPRGKHTLSGTKRGGAVMSVDAFRVSDLINDSDPEIVFDTTTRHDARAAALEGPWEPRGSSWINGQRFTFTFHGTVVEVQGGAAHGSGDLVLTLDGQPHSTVHCHGGQTTRTLATISGLSNGQHTVVGQYTNPHPGGFISALDGFVVTRPDYWSREGGRGLGELGNDAHVSTLKNAVGRLSFHGSGVEVIVTRDSESRTAHYTLDGGGSSLWVGLNHYSPVTIPGAAVFRCPNLVPGRHKVSVINGANPSGVNFSSVRLAVDAIRVHKGESSSASPLFWGSDGRGESGTWDAGASANWHDGASAVTWQDFGAEDHLAVFAGKGGMIELAVPVRVNRMVFRADGYTFRGQAIELTGTKPSIQLAEAVRAVFAVPVRIADAAELTPGSYTAATHPDLIVGGGTLVVASPR